RLGTAAGAEVRPLRRPAARTDVAQRPDRRLQQVAGDRLRVEAGRRKLAGQWAMVSPEQPVEDRKEGGEVPVEMPRLDRVVDAMELRTVEHHPPAPEVHLEIEVVHEVVELAGAVDRKALRRRMEQDADDRVDEHRLDARLQPESARGRGDVDGR